ncbi:envoplakin-like [Xiphophorus maculatus]|uniref:envoplakin-like n=1 Tax=Xiphophorus maculatus TaxID=8083 RepID=UPI000C6E6BDD|nr:envoplakin-like [Xiphophorus maculatus]
MSKMFKSKDTKSSSKMNRSQSTSANLLVAKMQSNSDEVVNNILKAEKLLIADNENDKKEKKFEHKDEINTILGIAEGLLEKLFLDIGNLRLINYPHVAAVEADIRDLHNRWSKDTAEYVKLYEQIEDVSLMPRINWEPVFAQKERALSSDEYGPTLEDLEKQIAAQNILHKELEAYSSQLCISSAGSKDKYTPLKRQYNTMLEKSKLRSQYLSSLYQYMRDCNKEMTFLGEEQEKIKKQDWSDQMADPSGVRLQYENFKNKELLDHEGKVNRLEDDGETYISLKHPASQLIEAQNRAVKNEWQKFLNLCICQEEHLNDIQEFNKYQMDSQKLSETLSQLNSTTSPESVKTKSNIESLLQLQVEENSVHTAEQQLADLRRRSTTIPPLKLRRTPTNKPITVVSLCDWETDKGSISREEKFTLKSFSDNNNWKVISSDGATKTFPGVCFTIPPPDPDAIDNVNLLGSELAETKRRRAALAASLKNNKSEISRAQQSVPVSSAPLDPKLAGVAQQLNQLDSDLANMEQGMLSRLRTPVSCTDPTGDLAKKLREQEQAAKALNALEQQRQTAQANLQPLLSKDPNGASSGLPQKLSAANDKYDNLARLADLYNKKANASLNLENQIQKVDGLVSGFERNLSADGPIPDIPNAIQARAEDVQRQRRSVAAAQDDMIKLNQDLEATEKLCSSLQKNHQEYCPDIRRQRNDVKQLQSRYTNVANQLKERENVLQEASAKHKDFQNTCQSLNSFLDNLPTNQTNSSDDLSQLTAKQSSQKRVVDDLKRKEEDMERVADLSQDLQNLLNEYEADVDKYNGTLEQAGTAVPKKPQMLTLCDAVDKEERNLTKRYAEATSQNIQRQKQMDLAKNLISQSEEKVQMVAQQQVQLENQQKNASKLDSLFKELEEEKERTTHAQTELKTYKTRMMSLKSRRGVERVEEKEVLQYYRDPKLQADLAELSKILNQEALKRTTTQAEVEILNKKITVLEETINNKTPKLLTREVTEFEKDPQLDVEAAKIRDEIARMRDEIRVKDGEQIQMKTEVSILQQKRPTIKERVVKKEVVKVEQDPQMLKELKIFENDISDENNKCKLLNDEIFQTRSQINALQRMIPNIQPKVIVKEVKKIEQDPDLITESAKLRTVVEDERVGNSSLSQEVIELHKRYREVQDWKPRIEIKEIVNEIYRIDPNTEVEIVRLRKEIQDSNKQRTDLEKEIRQVNTDLNALRSEKPKVEFKEVTQEVVKEERSPENEREIQRLNDQVNRLDSQCTSLEDQVRQLQKERDEWKAEKSKIETQLVNRELIKYEPDPLLEKEAERLQKKVRDEAQLRRSIEEMVFDLQNKFLLLERQKPEEKVVMQEVVRLQKDPRQAMEHDRLSRNLDEEVTRRRQLDLELQQLRTKLEDKERIIRESDEHQKRIQAESELREIRLRITQLENAPPPVEESIVVEEVLKVERDPKLERMTNGLRSDMDKETHDILRIQREIRNLTVKLEILQKEKSGEKTVYKEVVRVEKDQAVEAERDRLREQVSQNKFARQDLEDEIRRLNDKINFLMSTKSNNSREVTNLSMNKDTLVRENDNLTQELRTLEAKKHDTSLSFQQQSRLMTERTQMNRQKSVKMESDVQQLERQILDEKDKIHERDSTIREILMYLQKEEQAETRTKETNVSTKITILDPDTGKDMSPYDAYLGGLIDRQQYIHLQELECDWEEITSKGPDGETSVLLDRKSGKQYSIKDAIKEGRLTKDDLQQYKQGKLPISEFALLVAGDKTKQPKFTSVTQTPNSSAKSPSLDLTTATETQPIAGIMDTYTDTCFTIRNATLRKLIDPATAQRLLEAQAATGGITDISNKERCKVSKAAQRGLIEDSQLQRLLNAEKAFTGVEDPMTKECLSVGEAVQKGWTPKESAIRYMEAQHLTGGLVDPATGRRVTLIDALGSKMIDNSIARNIQTETAYIKDIVDPITNEKINYKQALDRCRKDPATGLPMLLASSKESGYNSSKYARF